MLQQHPPNHDDNRIATSLLRQLHLDVLEYSASLERFKDGIMFEYHDVPRRQGMSDNPQEQLYLEWLTFAAMDNTEAAYEFTMLSEVLRSIQGPHIPDGEMMARLSRRPLMYINSRREPIEHWWLGKLQGWEQKARDVNKYLPMVFEAEFDEYCDAMKGLKVHLQLLNHYMKSNRYRSDQHAGQRAADPGPALKSFRSLVSKLAKYEDGLRLCVKMIQDKARADEQVGAAQSVSTAVGKLRIVLFHVLSLMVSCRFEWPCAAEECRSTSTDDPRRCKPKRQSITTGA